MKSIRTGFVCFVLIFLTACGSSTDSPGDSPGVPNPFPTPIERTDNVLIGAYYYSWYRNADWMGRNSQSPLAGKYDSSDFTATQRHLNLLKNSGVDFLSLEQIESVNVLNEGLIAHWKDSPKDSSLKFCVFYDIAIWFHLLGFDVSNLELSENPLLKVFISKHVSIFSDYMKMGNYLHINGRPVFIIYVSHKLPPETFQFLLDEFSSKGMNPYVVGDEAYYGLVDGQHLENRLQFGYLDAVTVYNSYDGRGSAAFTEFDRQETGAQIASESDVGYFSHCVVTYDDTKWPDRNYLPLLPNDVNDIRSTLSSCFNNVFKLPGRNDGVLLFTTFNEWFEGSSLEPSERYGSLIIDSIQEFKSGSFNHEE
jgi:hypothetical protein